MSKLSYVGALAQIPCCAALLAADVATVVASSISLGIVGVLDKVFGGVKKPAWHSIRYSCPVVNKDGKDDYEGEIDVERTLEKSTFPISPEQLIQMCKAVCASNFGCTSTELLADDFQFVAPIVGPLPKHEFVKAFSEFDVRTAFPNQKENFWGFSVDPQEPNRVWFWSRAESVHAGPLKFGPKTIAPTGIRIVHPPQALSMLFDESGKVYTLTVGYVMDRRIGNTGGMGGLFGPLFAVGHALPFKEGQPWQPSLRLQMLDRIQAMAVAFGLVK